LAQGEFVITTPTQKFKLLQPYTITHLNGRFESSATGFQNGLSPMFKYMQAHGAQTQAASKQSNAIAIIILVVIVIGVIAVVLLSKK
jgi:hypothetical protein